MSAAIVATPRIRSGVPGLDEVLQGGLPRGTLLLIEGPPGSGKTTFGLQFLLQGVREGETCLLASNAETLEQLKSIAASHAWNLDGIHVTEFTEPAAGTEDDEGSGYTLFPEAEVELGETLQHLFAEIERLRPTRLVLDTISVLRVLAPTPGFYRHQLKRIRDFVLAQSCTTLMLDEASRTDEKDLRSQTLADGIVDFELLDFKYGADRRQLRVRKLRGCSYFSGAHDFNIVTGGLIVFPRLVARTHAEIPTFEPLSSGVAQIDALLGGGLPRGSCTLVMGPAGSGKSTIATVYAMAAAKRGEHCSILLFDESAESHIARSQGLGFDIAAAIEAGRIRVEDLDPAELSLGQIAHLLVRQVEEDNVGAHRDRHAERLSAIRRGGASGVLAATGTDLLSKPSSSRHAAYPYRAWHLWFGQVDADRRELPGRQRDLAALLRGAGRHPPGPLRGQEAHRATRTHHS